MIKIGGFNFIFTDAAHTLDSLNEMSGDVVLKQLPTSRASMENHCTEAVALLDTLASKTPLLEMIWKQLAALRETRVHDGGKYLNQPPNNFQNGLQIGNCDILLNYDYFMMDAEDFYKNYDLDKPEILEAKRKTQAMQSAMPLVLITTLFHELGHLLEERSDNAGKDRSQLRIDGSKIPDKDLAEFNAVCKFNRHLQLSGDAVKEHIKHSIDYQYKSGDAETVSVALELYTLFKLIGFEKDGTDAGLGPFQELSDEVQSKLAKIIEGLYPTPKK